MNNYKNHLILSGSLIRDALELLDKLAIDAILFVVDDQNKLIGALTDGDVRRGLLKGVLVGQVIDKILQSNPHFIRKGENDIKKVIHLRDNQLRIIPVIDVNDRVVNVINFREMYSYLPIDAVIMAGGKGQRLLPLTEHTPKPLLKVGGKPIIEHNIDRLSLFGIDDFWISVNYLGEQIEAYLGKGTDKNINISYVKEGQKLGTVGAVSLIDSFQHDYILISNSDLLTNIDYEKFFIDFLKHDADISVVTIPYLVNIPYAVLEINDKKIVSFKEKPTYTYFSNGGIYLLKRSTLDYIPKGKVYNATDMIEELIKENKKVHSYPLIGYWLDIGTHEDFNKAQIDVENINL